MQETLLFFHTSYFSKGELLLTLLFSGCLLHKSWLNDIELEMLTEKRVDMAQTYLHTEIREHAKRCDMDCIGKIQFTFVPRHESLHSSNKTSLYENCLRTIGHSYTTTCCPYHDATMMIRSS